VAAPAIVTSCFHCGLEVAPGSSWRTEVLGETRDFCCAGCRERFVAAPEKYLTQGVKA